ncbi:MAG TPA: poly-gamma-glutamate biosynthesis protein [Lachnospiraceae bacterium]|nr:poly-gamma-glutamate biosynthesis protein [Lachnospiraceae bacterium]
MKLLWKKYSSGFWAGLFLAIFSVLLISTVRVSAADTRTVDLVAVGDDLIHSSIYKACKTRSGYNFDTLFKHIRKDVQAADISVINQETILVGRNYSGYPSFGSPKAVADAVAKAGFNVVTHATNHTLDRGTNAIMDTLGYWNRKYPDIKVLGIHKSRNAANKITVVQKNGIRIAMLNYTYGLNGYRLPAGKKYMIDLLTSQNRNKIRRDIKSAKKKSDFVIVFTHWGTEYRYSPDSSQKNWTNFFLDNGVDLLIGTHPHVLEPYRMLKGNNGKKMLVYYSLGNFVSSQNRVPRLLGGMAKVTIVKNSKGTYVKKYGMEPLVTHISNRYKSFTVYKLRDYTDTLAGKNYIRRISPREAFNVRKLKSLYKKITGRKA